MSVNKAILVGHLGKDPEVRYTNDQKQVVTFSLATNDRRKDATTGEWIEQTEWHRIVTFGRTAEICGQYLKKGKQVYLEGRIRTNKWQDKEGNTRYTTEIIGDIVQFLGSARDSGASVQTMPEYSEQPADKTVLNSLPTADQLSNGNTVKNVSFEEDDIPF